MRSRRGESAKGPAMEEQADRIGSAEKDQRNAEEFGVAEPEERGEWMRQERADAPRRSERPPSKDWCVRRRTYDDSDCRRLGER